MAAKVEYKASVAKDLRKLDRPNALRLLSRIEKLLLHQGSQGKPLTGEFAGLFSLRAGDYRIIYTFDVERNTIHLLAIGHRREIYRAT